jgi:PmbA protein
MQSDSWSSNKRCPLLLENHQTVAHKAAKRAQDKLDARKLSTRKCPVIFDSTVAADILRPIFSALGGRAQYQKNSFLLNALGEQILPSFLSIYEDPFVKKGLSSSPFDDDGAKVEARFNVQNGIIQHYFLSAYSARKLNIQNTGHAGGTHNLYLQADQQHIDSANKVFANLDALLKHMHTGLLITDVMGQGVNITTGDYSKGVSGFWVENGIILHAVEEITIAGNIKDMLKNIQGIALDTYEGRLHTGSILLENMTVAGI